MTTTMLDNVEKQGVAIDDVVGGDSNLNGLVVEIVLYTYIVRALWN